MQALLSQWGNVRRGITMYLIEWLSDFEVLERELLVATTVSEAIAKARANSSRVAARLGREPDRFRVKDQGMKELAVVALAKPR
jgi:hypothetical protein